MSTRGRHLLLSSACASIANPCRPVCRCPSGAQLQPDGAHGVEQRRVLARFAAGRHPVALSFTRGSSIGAASRLVMASPTACAGSRRRRRAQGASGVRSPIAMASPRKPHGRQVTRNRPRHLPRADHLVAVRQPAHGTVADGHQEALARHRGVAQHVQRHGLQLHARQIERGGVPRQALHVAVHARRLAQQHVSGMSMTRSPPGPSSTTSSRPAVATPTTANGQRSRSHICSNSGIRSDSRPGHSAPALVAPDLLGRQAGFLQRHAPQVEVAPCLAPSTSSGKRCSGPGAHVVNRQDRVHVARRAARPLRSRAVPPGHGAPRLQHG